MTIAQHAVHDAVFEKNLVAASLLKPWSASSEPLFK